MYSATVSHLVLPTLSCKGLKTFRRLLFPSRARNSVLVFAEFVSFPFANYRDISFHVLAGKPTSFTFTSDSCRPIALLLSSIWRWQRGNRLFLTDLYTLFSPAGHFKRFDFCVPPIFHTRYHKKV